VEYEYQITVDLKSTYAPLKGVQSILNKAPIQEKCKTKIVINYEKTYKLRKTSTVSIIFLNTPTMDNSMWGGVRRT
jgi:hypothetical protein